MENIKYHLIETSKCASISCGNQKKWFTATINAPPKITT